MRFWPDCTCCHTGTGTGTGGVGVQVGCCNLGELLPETLYVSIEYGLSGIIVTVPIVWDAVNGWWQGEVATDLLDPLPFCSAAETVRARLLCDGTAQWRLWLCLSSTGSADGCTLDATACTISITPAGGCSPLFLSGGGSCPTCYTSAGAFTFTVTE